MGGAASYLGRSGKSKKETNNSGGDAGFTLSIALNGSSDGSSSGDDRLLGAGNGDDGSSIYTGTLNNSDSRVSFTGLPFHGRHIYINVINIKHPEEHKWLQSHAQYILSILQSNELSAYNNPTNQSHEKVMFLCAEFRFKQISHFSQVIINEPDVLIDVDKSKRKSSRKKIEFDNHRYDIDRWSNTDSTMSSDVDSYIQLVNSSNVYVFVNMKTGNITWTFPNNIPISCLKYICHMHNGERQYFDLKRGETLNSLPIDAMDENVIEECQTAEKLNNELLGNHIRQPYKENVSSEHANWLENSLLGEHEDDTDNAENVSHIDENHSVLHDSSSVLSNTISIDTIHTEIRGLKYYVSGLRDDQPYLVVHSIDASVNRLRSLELNRGLRWAPHTLLCLNVSNNLLTSLEGIQICQNLKLLDASCNLITSIGPLKGCKHLERLQIAGNRIKSLKFDDIELDKYDTANVSITSGHTASVDDKLTETSNTDKASSELEDKTDNSSEHHAEDVIMQLISLDIQDNPVNSLEGFRAINKHLQYLDIRNCDLDDKALEELFGLPLETLNADNNKISNLTKALELLRTLKNLHHLAFIGNPIAKSDTNVNEEGLEKDRQLDNDKSQGNGRFYTIAILDAVSSLKSLDHLSIAPSMYRNLELMKNQLEAQAFVQEVTSFYAHEMAALSGIQRNLLQRHQFEQFTLEKAVKSRTAQLQEEMNDFISYSQTKISKGLAQIQIDLLSAEINEDTSTDNNTIKENSNRTTDSLERLQKNVYDSQGYLNDLKEQFAALKRRTKRESEHK